jgi:cation:H+ antiporter
MQFTLYITLFLISGSLLYFSGNILIRSLSRLSKIFRVREFFVAFFIMAIASSIPNLFVGITSAIKGIPELSLGDILGNNFIAMTLAVAIGVLASKRKEIIAHGMMIKTSIFFTFLAALSPIILSFDGLLSRTDGIILLFIFAAYVHWLISQQEHHTETYGEDDKRLAHGFKSFIRALKDIVFVTLSVGTILAAATGIVKSATFFADYFNVSIILIGLLITGLGNALPEIFFSYISARRGETSLILGNILGSIMFPATFVLGIVLLIHNYRYQSDCGEPRTSYHRRFAFLYILSKQKQNYTQRSNHINTSVCHLCYI